MNKTKNCRWIAILLFLCVVIPTQSSAKAPKLIGNGVADDTPAIQALLDLKEPLVYLPAPKKNYLINKSLRIHSGQTLKLDPTTVIRLADNANDYMLTNADLDSGNRNIFISGGIWDGNNRGVNHAKGPRNGKHPRDFFIGSLFMLMYVENLCIENLTVKDPEKFGIHLGACRRFTVKQITFDYNAAEANMDGVHLQGGCSDGRITDLKGNTYDDMVALNSDDGEYWEITKGQITDIQIDGLWADNCFRAVRFLSTGTPVKRISISNIFGSYYTNTIAFTHWRMVADNPRFEDISISNVYTAKVTDPELLAKLKRNPDNYGIIGIEGQLIFNNLTLTNIFRTEYLSGAAPTIHIQQGTIIETLRMTNVQQDNRTDKPLTLLYNEGCILRFFLNDVVIREKNTENPNLFAGDGQIIHREGKPVILNEQEVLKELNRVKEEVRANPGKGHVL